MIARRMKELVGMLMIGDGVLALLEPRRHVLLWRRGPAAWQSMMDQFVRRPGLTRGLGAVEAILGFWLASRQMIGSEVEDATESVHPTKAFAETP